LSYPADRQTKHTKEEPNLRRGGNYLYSSRCRPVWLQFHMYHSCSDHPDTCRHSLRHRHAQTNNNQSHNVKTRHTHSVENLHIIETTWLLGSLLTHSSSSSSS